MSTGSGMSVGSTGAVVGATVGAAGSGVQAARSWVDTRITAISTNFQFFILYLLLLGLSSTKV
jgi:hypothetical protein